MTVNPKLARLVRTAVAEERLRVHYQPCVRLADGSPVAVEALLRMDDGEGGTVMPDVFIPVAESSGAIGGMGLHVLAAACEQMAWWKDRLPRDAELVVAINLSPRQLTDPCLVEAFESARGRLAPSAIVVELTEHQPTPSRPEELSLLHELCARGYHLFLDDFGTGHASARSLRELPFDGVKLDRSWTSRLSRGDAAGDLARSLASLALRSGRKVVVEGIETEQGRDAAAALGCLFGQGYLWSRPLPAEDMTRWLTAHAGLVADPPAATRRDVAPTAADSRVSGTL